MTDTHPGNHTGPKLDAMDEDTIVFQKTQTGPLHHRSDNSINALFNLPRPETDPSGDFLIVPASAENAVDDAGAPHWWIELWASDPGFEPIRLEIVGDAVIGRSAADVDLTGHGAVQFGISRRHALLRPSRKALYLIDLGSTNGTQCNGISVGEGVAVPLAVNSVIRLGNLTMTVRFLTS